MKAIKLIWMISMLAVLALLLYLNVILAPTIRLMAEEGNTFTLSKDTFFYLVLGLVVVLNGLLLIVGNIFPTLPKEFLLIPRRSFWTSTKLTRRMLTTNYKLWVKGLATVFNLALMVYMSFVHEWNKTDFYFPMNLTILSYLLVGFLMLWLLLFFVWFGYTKRAEEKVSVKTK